MNPLRSLEEIIKDIKSLIPEVDKEVGEIIKSKTLDKNKIELTLDFLMHPIMKKQFDKLVDYYQSIDKEAAEDYRKIYKEMYKEP